jgi:hypothetical protein
MSSTLRFNNWKSGDGSHDFFKCYAWVNFNGTGTLAIRASGNVSSITDNGTGDYTVNFATALPDANYAYTLGGQYPTNSIVGAMQQTSVGGQTASAFRLLTGSANANSAADYPTACVAVFR